MWKEIVYSWFLALQGFNLLANVTPYEAKSVVGFGETCNNTVSCDLVKFLTCNETIGRCMCAKEDKMVYYYRVGCQSVVGERCSRSTDIVNQDPFQHSGAALVGVRTTTEASLRNDGDNSEREIDAEILRVKW